jgi:hypothetical protein
MLESLKCFLNKLLSLFMRPKPRLLGVTLGREIKCSAYMTTSPVYWFYEIGDLFMIHGLFGAEIRGKLPKCLDRVSDSGKIRYLKRYIPKADRG